MLDQSSMWCMVLDGGCARCEHELVTVPLSSAPATATGQGHARGGRWSLRPVLSGLTTKIFYTTKYRFRQNLYAVYVQLLTPGPGTMPPDMHRPPLPRYYSSLVSAGTGYLLPDCCMYTVLHCTVHCTVHCGSGATLGPDYDSTCIILGAPATYSFTLTHS